VNYVTLLTTERLYNVTPVNKTDATSFSRVNRQAEHITRVNERVAVE
jgi:hypothetical protein